MRLSVLLFLIIIIVPVHVMAEDCTWNSDIPTAMTGACNAQEMATLSLRDIPTHTVKITNRGRTDGKYTVYESDGCSDKDRYAFCKGNGWAITGTPIKLNEEKIGLLTTSHFKRKLTEETICKDAAIFLPDHYELGGRLSKLEPIPVATVDPEGKVLDMLVDIRKGKENIKLLLNVRPRYMDLEGMHIFAAPTPKGMGNAFGGESGTSLRSNGSVQAVFTGFLDGPEPYSLMIMTPVSKIQELIIKALSASKDIPFVILE